MSTGIPISVVDGDAPPPAASGTGHGHGHGHSRSRGHSRSTRPMQVPSPISVPPSSLMAEVPSLQPVAGAAYTNGHASHPSWQGHHHSHSQGSVQFNSLTPSPVKSVFHDHGMDHKEEPDTPELSTKPATSHSHEVMSGLLIVLPWIVLSWFSTGFTRLATPSVDDLDATTSGTLEGKASKACALTACAIILLGCGQIFRQGQQKSSPGALDGALSKFSATTASTAFARVCSIGLPIYAGLKVGGFLVAFALSLVLASGLPTAQTNARDQFGKKKSTLALLATVILIGYFGGNTTLDQEPFMGYVALLVGVFVIRPPFTVDHPGSTPEIGLGLSVGRDSLLPDKLSATSSPEDAMVNVLSGLALALATVIVSGFPSPGMADLLYFGATAASFAASLLYSSTSALRSPRKFGHAAGMGAAALFCSPELYDDLFVPYLVRSALAAASFLAARFDDRHLRIGAHSHDHHHNHHHHAHSHSHSHPSKVTKMILHACEDYPLLHSILKESDSRRIFYFMILNFCFMIVQLSYGILTGSLGLLSDSIHMFFDCLALVVGLCAAVMSKWPPSFRFPYGYGKVDTLSGFANGIFLMIISIEIIYEAVERLSSGSQMNRIGELLIVSISGLLVNLVGIMAFDHGHAHGHDHGHDHGHSHGNENMHGIFLHILADTLGSVAVVISTILVHFSGWAGYDPIASCLIAILIFASAVPLVTSTAKTLLLTLPADVEYNLRDTLGGVSAIRGVAGYSAPKFWLDDTSIAADDHHHDHSHDHGHDHHGHDHHDHSHSHSHSHGHNHSHSHAHESSEKHNHCADHDHHDHDDHGKQGPRVLGVIHVIASRGADLEDVRQRTIDFLREKNMNITVQVEREGDGRCWCGGGNK